MPIEKQSAYWETNNGQNKGQKGFIVAHLNFVGSVWWVYLGRHPLFGQPGPQFWCFYDELWFEKGKKQRPFNITDCSTPSLIEFWTLKMTKTSAQMTVWRPEKWHSNITVYFIFEWLFLFCNFQRSTSKIRAWIEPLDIETAQNTQDNLGFTCEGKNHTLLWILLQNNEACMLGLWI